MITKNTIIDQIEIVGKYRHVQIQTAIIIEEDGIELSRSYHRHVISPISDYSNEDPEIQAICQTVFTPEIIEAYEQHLNNVSSLGSL